MPSHPHRNDLFIAVLSISSRTSRAALTVENAAKCNFSMPVKFVRSMTKQTFYNYQALSSGLKPVERLIRISPLSKLAIRDYVSIFEDICEG